VALGEGADVQHAGEPALERERNRQQGAHVLVAKQRVGYVAAVELVHVERAACVRKPLGEVLADGYPHPLLDDPGGTERRADRHRPALLLDLQDRGAVHREDLPDPAEELPKQVVEREMRERGVGDQLELAHRLRDRHGLAACRALA
jgi:hypothetical protein